MARTADDQAACDSADRTGEHHRADDYFFTLIPAWRAVFWLSPTTAISYPCLLYFMYTYMPRCDDQNNDHVQSIHISKMDGNHPFCPAALMMPTVLEPDGFSQNTMANVTSCIAT